MDREQTLRRLAARVTGMTYRIQRAETILDREDWQDFWPVVTRKGKRLVYTGEIIGGEEGWANVDDMAMIAVTELTPAELIIAQETGYFNERS